MVTAAFAAAAEAGLTGELAVCAGSAGPGNLHLINGLYDAQRSRVPVLAIAAHIPSDEIGSGHFQETHPQDLFRECSVYVEHVSNIDQMPRVLRIAMRAALEKRGAAVVVVSGDIALADVADNRVDSIKATESVVVPAERELVRAAELLNAGKNVTILAAPVWLVLTSSCWLSPGRSRRRWSMRCVARSTSSTTTSSTSG